MDLNLVLEWISISSIFWKVLHFATLEFFKFEQCTPYFASDLKFVNLEFNSDRETIMISNRTTNTEFCVFYQISVLCEI